MAAMKRNLALAVIAASLTGAAPEKIPVELFAKPPFLSDPALSPDGTRIAARARRDGQTLLIVFHTQDDLRGQTFDLGKFNIVDTNWAGPSRILLTISMTTRVFGAELPMTRLLMIDTRTNATKMLDDKSKGLFAGDILYADPAGEWVLVSGQNSIFETPSVKRIDLNTLAVKQVEKPRTDVWNWYADDAGHVRAGIAYSGERWTMWYRETADAPLRPIRAKAGGKEADAGSVDGIKFVTGNSNGLIITNARTGRFAAYRYDLPTGTIGEPYYENDEVDISHVIVNVATRKVTGVAYEDDRSRIAWLDPDMKAVQAKIDRALPNAENCVVDTTPDGNRILIWSGGAADPGTFYLYDRKLGRMWPLISPYDDLVDKRFATVGAVRYKARDGLSIPAYLTLPVGAEARGLPLIVMPHGGPHVRDSWRFNPWVQFLANRGYAVLQPNFRGSTGYGKAFVERGYGQWGRAMQDDIDDGVDWLVASGKVDPKRVCIMGASYGGYVAMWGAIRNPERYRCAISFAGVSDVPDMLRYDRKSFNAPRYFREWQRKVQGEDKLDLDAVSPLHEVARLNVPVLITHGEKDTNVPPRQSHRMVDALRQRGASVVSVFYPDEGHGLSSATNDADFLKRVEAFLKVNNPS